MKAPTREEIYHYQFCAFACVYSDAHSDSFQRVDAELEKMDWRPIATAPKDGTQIILCHDNEVYSGSWSCGAWDADADHEGQSQFPTHWRPMMALPGEDE